MLKERKTKYKTADNEEQLDATGKVFNLRRKANRGDREGEALMSVKTLPEHMNQKHGNDGEEAESIDLR